MHRQVAALLAVLALIISSQAALAYAPPASQDATAGSAVLDKRSALVVFKALPLATYDGRIAGYAKTRPTTGKLNPSSGAARRYLGLLKTQHTAFARWLQTNVPSAKITSQYYATLNAVAVKLNGNAIGKLSANSNVLAVEYNALYQPDMSESYKLINALGAWGAAGGRTDAGRGIKVGIIDSGIHPEHPFFDPAGFAYPPGFPKCDAADSTSHQANTNCTNVSPKVIVAKVFYNKNNQTDYTALPVADIGSHGTHVAGTVAGVTGKTAIVEGVSIDDMSGVAPGAWLGNYNVFPGEVVSARSEDILNAVEQAVLDGMDVLNLSLGGGYRGTNDLLAKGLDTAVAAGVVIATSAGNNGPGGFTIGSPGRARNIITVGASTNQHFVGQPLTYPAGGGTTVGAAVGDFPPLPSGSYNLFDTASNGCTSVAAGAAGKLAIINRGTCTFSAKVRNAIAAGAVGVLVINNVAGDPTAMAKDGLGGDNLPAVMIGSAEGAALRASGATTASAVASFSEFITANGDILAGFSSQGPTFVDYSIKPDLTSVGVNVLSSEACDTTGECGNDGDWAFYSGTSMSSPHIAGSAAVLKDLHPTWTPAQIKSALVNTADLVVKNAFNAATTVGPMAQGAGREDLTEAADTDFAFWPTSASYGRIGASRTASTPIAVQVTNLTGTATTLTLSEAMFVPAPTTGAGAINPAFNAGTINGDDPAVTLSTNSLVVPANGSATFTIRIRAGLAIGTRVQGWVKLTGGGAEYQVAYWAQVAG
jgi:minor extracellular serine protease Vpr